MSLSRETDVLIVGGGIMGASVAALLREASPDIGIVMVDAGEPIGPVVGGHLHETTDPEIWARYNRRVESGIQGVYAGDETYRPPAATLTDLEPGMHRLSALGQEADQLPGAALGWNAGGMGVHWTAATPEPATHERFGDPARWDDDLATARRLLRVSRSPLGPTPVGEIILDTLRSRFPNAPVGRGPQPMPMAVQIDGDRRVRTGPATIFPPIAEGGDARFSLLTGTIATTLDHVEGAVRGANVRRLADGVTGRIRAKATIVCADALRTPQLLFASNIRPRALGRYLNEHAFLSNRVLLDLDRFGIDTASLPPAQEGEWISDSLWLPTTGPEQPTQAQIMCRTYVDDAGAPLAYGIGVSIYVPVEARAENRVEFDDALDIVGMPRMSVQFSYSDSDLDAIERALQMMAGIAEDLGEWKPLTDSKLLAPGTSLHFTGTVRSGESEDGTSVCDPSGRVWGTEGIYVAGNGVIPTSLACNSTLTGVVTAVRAAHAVLIDLGADPRQEAVS